MPLHLHSFSKHTLLLMAILLNQSNKKSRSSLVKWSNIPEELLELIFERVRYDGNYIRVHAVRDLIRVGTVCKSWQSAVGSIKRQIGPLVLLPPINMKKNQDLYHLFDVSKNKACKIQLPEVRDKWICNSSNEWLVTMSRTPPYNHIHLFNPFSKVQIELPPPSTFEDRPLPVDETIIEVFIKKAIVSSSLSPSDPNFTVMAIHSNWNKLAFCRSGDTNWRTLKGTKDCYLDIIYYKGDFYAIGQRGNFVLCDVSSPEPKAINVAPTLGLCHSELYLAESLSGDLLRIDRYINWDKNDINWDEINRDEIPWDDGNYFTENFEVFKFDFRNKQWKLVNNLGDNSIFIGHNVSMSVFAKEFSIRSNCIYFMDDHLECYFESKYGCHDMGVFDLKTKLVEPTFQFSKKWPSPLFWISADSTSLAVAEADMNMNAWKPLKL